MKLLVMSFDGETKLENPIFKSIKDTWSYDIGSKWYFYPFYFVVTDSGKTIKDAPYPLDFLIGMRIKTVSKRFAELCEKTLSDNLNLDAETFSFYVANNW